nr:exported hypothetical protein [Serratia symbiotica]
MMSRLFIPSTALLIVQMLRVISGHSLGAGDTVKIIEVIFNHWATPVLHNVQAYIPIVFQAAS